jgi:hypothetical protein
MPGLGRTPTRVGQDTTAFHEETKDSKKHEVFLAKTFFVSFVPFVPS